jgi:hypothetical protein
MTRKIKIILYIIATYITVVGLVTFALFIHEEAIQTAIWGTWPAQDAKQWHLVKKGIAIVDSINTSMKIINYTLGWIQPLACVAYYQYARSTDYYVETLTAKVFANAPELYVGEEVTLEFIPRETRRLAQGDMAVSGRIGVYLKDHVEAFSKTILGRTTVTGILLLEDKMLIIR